MGVGLLLLGLTGAGAATLLQLTSLLVFGPLLLTSSIIQLLTAFFAGKGKDNVLHMIAAGLEAVLGFFIMANPPQNVNSLIAAIAIFLIVAGLVRLARSLTMQARGRVWIVLTGVLALLLGMSVWIGWPFGELWFVGLCIALDFLCHGMCWSALALTERTPLQEV
jgi:uncharacterized membrane protein HdeD (DUF308 family)